jgi:excisionase family DNA binding protein
MTSAADVSKSKEGMTFGMTNDSNLQLPVSRLLNSQEVATALRIHRKTLQRYVRERRITATSTGKNLKFRPADVHAFYNAHLKPAGRSRQRKFDNSRLREVSG